MNNIIKATTVGLICTASLLVCPLSTKAQFVTNLVTFSNVVIRSSSDVTGPYTNLFTLPDVTLEYRYHVGSLQPFFYHFKLSTPVIDADLFETSLTLQYAFNAGGPYDDIYTYPTIAVTNPAGNAFFRSAFDLTDTNFVFVDPYTVQFVPPP